MLPENLRKVYVGEEAVQTKGDGWELYFQYAPARDIEELVLIGPEGQSIVLEDLPLEEQNKAREAQEKVDAFLYS